MIRPGSFCETCGRCDLLCDVCGRPVSSSFPCGICGVEPSTAPTKDLFLVCEHCAEKHFADHRSRGELKPSEVPPMTPEQLENLEKFKTEFLNGSES
jgi:hypothetical protein